MGASEVERALKALEGLSSLLNQVDEDEPGTLSAMSDSLREILDELKKLPCVSQVKLTELLAAAERLLAGQMEALQEMGITLDEVFIELGKRGCVEGREETEGSSSQISAASENSTGPLLPEKEAEELFMDLEVLAGLAEELDPSFVPGMVNILERNLSREGLDPSLRESLERVMNLLSEYERGTSGLEDEILTALRKALQVLAALSGKKGTSAQGTSVSWDETVLERALEHLDDLEAYLVSAESAEVLDPSPTVEVLQDIAEKASSLGLEDLSEDLSRAVTSLRVIRSAGNILDPLLALKDKLHSHIKALLEGKEHPHPTEDIRVILDYLASTAVRGGSRENAPTTGVAPGVTTSPPAGVTPGVSPVKGLEADLDELTDFVAEAPEDLQRVETALLELEKEPENKEWLNEAFRGFHNLKGSAGFLKLEDMVNVAHAAESILSEAREGRIMLTGVYADLALQALDLLKEMLRRVEGHMRGETYSSPEEYPEVLSRLRSWRELGQGMEPSPRGIKVHKKEAAVTGSTHQTENHSSSPSVQNGGGEGQKPSRVEEAAPAKTLSSSAGTREQFVKVSTTRLDNLIDVVGELVIAHSMVAQEEELRTTRNPRLAKNLSQLAKIIRELQELAMALRMVSLKGTFQKMARAARDLSVRSGVPVEFTYSGEDTEIDRNVVEEIANPLVHMIRNAIDHGIEPPDERRARGKTERGHIHLRGYHQGGNVVIELEDDGRGIDPAKVLAKARTLGLVREDEELSREEVLQLIFREGFSTAEKITDISGRGVGMDVVKRTVESLRGRVEVHSEVGKGTRVVLRLPLTLAIIDGMVTSVGGENYILPSIAIKESFRPAPGQVKTVSGRGELILSRGELIPLFRLHRLFGVQGAVEDPHQALVLVVGENGRKCGLMVDEIEGQQQVVIKPLGDSLPRLPGVAGGAIMGSGRVALILDPQELLCMATRR